MSALLTLGLLELVSIGAYRYVRAVLSDFERLNLPPYVLLLLLVVL